ncbi:DEP domain-containing mTOR-interacting protein isoform 2 [Daubentonia madagascariensis]|uniref:DEP domain-containing mTOR-interacting protein isoform 2 n=1 Tax=Daubentonia madagascariensis TaxID=31869 RepID=A0ABD2DKB4_DAUMA
MEQGGSTGSAGSDSSTSGSGGAQQRELERMAEVLVTGEQLRLMSPENTLLQPREEEGVKYERTFMASEFLDWLVQEGEATTRKEAEQLCHRLMEHGIIQHVSPSKEIKIVSAVRRSSMSSCGSSGYFSSSPTLGSSPPVLCNPKSVLKRPVTSEELLTPGAPYARKTFTIVGDAVGWGFVVRGSKPCHIQAVDPSGPAAAAGMKVCQFVVSVNGLNVLHVDYRTVSNLILTGPRTIVMEVMEELEH